ncbi:MAG: thiol reductase thioredoxin, partial [Planctomycetia bacterium]|nr:thiol reductase thioredoxin [Planctomycetia bacterium]
WAPGCAPCTKLSPIMESLAGQFAGRVKVGKVDISENFDLASEFNISSVPRLLVFHRNPKPRHHLRGLVAEGELVKLLKQVLGA